jgi:hypothetical protein
MKPRNRYCYFLRVAIGADGVFVCKRGFKTPEFATWAKNVVLVELDYPRRAHKLLRLKAK